MFGLYSDIILKSFAVLGLTYGQSSAFNSFSDVFLLCSIWHVLSLVSEIVYFLVSLKLLQTQQVENALAFLRHLTKISFKWTNCIKSVKTVQLKFHYTPWVFIRFKVSHSRNAWERTRIPREFLLKSIHRRTLHKNDKKLLHLNIWWKKL